jgi:hypothetical protein
MTEPKPRGPSPVLLVAILAAVIFLGIVIFVVTQGRGGESDDGPPPELGPDTAQATPATIAEPTVQPAQLNDPPAQGDAASSKIHFSDDVLLAFDATFPGPADDPVIAPLYKEAENRLALLKADVRDELAERKKTGASPGVDWSGDIRWSYTAKAGGIVSLFGTLYEFTGGAHGTTAFDTVIARQNGITLKFNDMLVLKRSPSPAMTVAICEALKAEKQKKIGSATIHDEPITCIGPNANVKLDSPTIALAPSSQPGKFGGVYVIFQQYEVGPYAEGSYIVTVQQEIFAEDLKPEFKPLFAGVAPPFS